MNIQKTTMPIAKTQIDKNAGRLILKHMLQFQTKKKHQSETAHVKKTIADLKSQTGHCAITLGAIGVENDEFNDVKAGKLLNCGHAFEATAIQKWLETKASCPTCKKPAPKKSAHSKIQQLIKNKQFAEALDIAGTLTGTESRKEAALILLEALNYQSLSSLTETLGPHFIPQSVSHLIAENSLFDALSLACQINGYEKDLWLNEIGLKIIENNKDLPQPGIFESSDRQLLTAVVDEIKDPWKKTHLQLAFDVFTLVNHDHLTEAVSRVAHALNDRFPFPFIDNDKTGLLESIFIRVRRNNEISQIKGAFYETDMLILEKIMTVLNEKGTLKGPTALKGPFSKAVSKFIQIMRNYSDKSDE